MTNQQLEYFCEWRVEITLALTPEALHEDTKEEQLNFLDNF